ncbi:MAG: methylmalonyl-CoA mutase, partial [Acidobacteriota bacterium]
VGKVGVAIDSLKDMELLFQEIPLDKVSTSMTINSTAAIILAMYLAVARKQGVPLEKLSGTIQNDILKEYISRGTYIFPPSPSLRLTIDIFSYCIENLPRWNFISVSGYHIREAGATAVQEVAFTLANAIAYVEAAIKRGFQVDSFAPRISFFFNSHNHFLEEVAKFRAARRLWARIMKDRFHAKNPRSMMLRFHTQTAGSTLTAQQPDNNIVRVTLQALAAVLGGTQSLHTNSREEALALPSEESVQIALRTQQIIAHESGVANTVDPLGGCYLIERLTSEIESKAMEYIKRIDQIGGSLKAIEAGFFHREIQDSAYRYQKEIEEGRGVVVGVNKYATEEKAPFQLLTIDPKVEKDQIERLRKLKQERDSHLVARVLDEVEQAAKGEQNLIPPILQAVEAYATVGEISDCLREVFGVYQEPSII